MIVGTWPLGKDHFIFRECGKGLQIATSPSVPGDSGCIFRD